ncbi:uncharacterized protein LOC128683183 [Plodia interpunctella]|uniref:uncharacterized protein LOC128683183 n=1 Tax=Plodia interpunctella TaxID=58824 RepID=UPI002367DDDA|nr:uncharacterized protein LOC128683183 [Plodia interpunctella]
MPGFRGIQRPYDLKYMRYLRVALMIIGAWPGKDLGEGERFRLVYKFWNFVICFHNLIAGAVYLWNNMRDIAFYEVVETLLTVLMIGVCVHDILITDFIVDIHLFRHSNVSEYLCHFFTLYTYVFVVFLFTFSNLILILNNISKGGFSRQPPPNKTYEHSVYYQLPFDYQHNFNGFMFVFIFNCASTVCTSAPCV